MKARLLMCAVALALLAGCPNAYRAGWVSTASVMQARDAADDGIEKAFTAKVDACARTHGGDQIKTQKCVTSSPEYNAAANWTRVILPAVNTSLRTAKAILEIAEKVQATEASVTAKVLDALKDGLCKMLPALQEWTRNPNFPDALKTALKYAQAVSGVVCK